MVLDKIAFDITRFVLTIKVNYNNGKDNKRQHVKLVHVCKEAVEKGIDYVLLLKNSLQKG